MSISDQDNFNALSALLTGFNQQLIAPQVDPIGLPSTFLKYATAHSNGECAHLLATFAALQALTPALAPVDIGQVVMGLAKDPNTGALIPENQALVAHAILKMWYLGSWYQPFDLNGVKEGEETVVSDQAYIKGLAWQAMQSHAMGNSTFTFGYWDKPPAASLAVTTGNTDVTGDASPSASGWGAST
jgi:hypothetical protein